MSKIKLPKIHFVEQHHKNGCAAACIAMVTGKNYDDVISDFANDFERRGILGKQIIKYLAFCGKEIILKKVEYFNESNFGRDEILRPFAPIHILTVRQYFDSNVTHAVVMDAEGKIFCPSNVPDEQIRRSYMIEEIIGIY